MIRWRDKFQTYLSKVLLELAGLEIEGIVLEVLVLGLDCDLAPIHSNNTTLQHFFLQLGSKKTNRQISYLTPVNFQLRFFLRLKVEYCFFL